MANIAGSAGEILAILRAGQPRTTSELSSITGQARSTVTSRLAELQKLNLVTETTSLRATGGRPSVAYLFAGQSQYILAADLGANLATLALLNLRAEVLTHWQGELRLEDGPNQVLSKMIHEFQQLLEKQGVEQRDVIGLGVSLAAPVNFTTGEIEGLSILPEWDNFNIVEPLEKAFDCKAAIDNDANVLAVGEQRLRWPNVEDLIYVKISGGIAAGIISGGAICRGSEGVAGDIGHIYTEDAKGKLCICGNRGCVTAYAGGHALAIELHERGFETITPTDVVNLARTGNGEVAELIRDAARTIGTVMATCVSVINPEVIVFGGELSALGEPLVAGVREVIYGRARPHTTRNLQVVIASDDSFSGVTGISHMILDIVLAPENYELTFSKTK
jgi:predicted NBD/HSP70 family sugar kinase